jgi:predicted helicase
LIELDEIKLNCLVIFKIKIRRRMDNLQDELYKIFLKSPTNLFDEFILECQKWYEMPAHSFSEMRMRDNKKIRGDIFEEFCVLYLKYVKGYKNVWLLKDVPDAILDKLALKRRDMGIDIIVETIDEKYVAVQCKYKKHTGCKLNILSWRSLSTFYALCLRSGPWDKYIIMTNCVYTRHQGKKTSQDVSYCLKTLQNITKDEWLRMCNVSGVKIGSEEVKVLEETIEEKIAKPKAKSSKIVLPSKEEIRALRLSFYNI